MSAPEVVTPQGIGPDWLLRQRLGGPGDVCTFYSYKGGTGRTMSLVNCAGLVAQQLVQARELTQLPLAPPLLIDFDLEAPGLHRYLAPLLPLEGKSKAGGVLELFELLSERVDAALTQSGVPTLDDASAAEIVQALDLDPFKQTVVFPSVVDRPPATLQFIAAGRFDDEYDARLQRFDWPRLHARAPALFRAFSAKVAADHPIVFIDSRTGLSDTSGICTMLLPDVLVVVFTPNSQSLTGIEHLVRKAVAYRAESVDLRALRVYPLPARVDNQVEHFRKVWREGDANHPMFGTVQGYQPLFTQLFGEVTGRYDDIRTGMAAYFDQVQVPHAADYAYGERLCFMLQGSTDSLSIRGAYESFLPWLLTGAQPWRRPADELNDLRAQLWLRTAGVAEPPAVTDDWTGWFERIARVMLSTEGPDRGPPPALTPLRADLRFDFVLARSLAQANVGDFGAARTLLAEAATVLDDNLAPSLLPGAPAALLGLLLGDAPPPEAQADATAWLEALDGLMARWQPLPRERRAWLQALLPLAVEWGQTELRLRAAIDLQGPGSEVALQATLAAAKERERVGDVTGALALVRAGLGAAKGGAEGPAAELAQLLPQLRGLAARNLERPLPALSDCENTLWMSYSQHDDDKWGGWISGFKSELVRSLRASMRSVRLPPLSEPAANLSPNRFLAEKTRREISRSFAFMLVVGEDLLLSDRYRTELDAFLRLYGPAAAERLYLVAMTKDALERVLEWKEWDRLGPPGPPIGIAFYKPQEPQRPLDIYLEAGLVSPEFRRPFEQLRDQLVYSLRASLNTSPSHVVAAQSGPAVPAMEGQRPAVIYIESNRLERNVWTALGERLVERWDRLQTRAGQPRRALRVRGLPIDHLDGVSLLDAAGIVLLWGAKEPEVLVTQVDKIERVLPTNDGAPGLVAYLSPPRPSIDEAIPAFGWEVLRFDMSDPEQPSIHPDDAGQLDRFLETVMKVAARREVGTDGAR